MKTIHYVQLVLGALVAASTSVAGADPALASYAHIVGAVAGAVLTALGLVSPSALPQAKTP